MIKYIVLFSVFFVVNSYAQEEEFENVLSLFEESNKKIPEALALKYFNVTISERISGLVTGGILVKTSDYVLLSTILECNIADNCTQSSVTSFTTTGTRIATIAYERQVRDCSFDDTRASVFIASDLLVFKETRRKLDCVGDGSQTGMKEWLEFQPIKEDGSFSKPFIDKKAISREHYIFSYRVFTKEELETKTEEELGVIKNEIFASRGYVFTSKEWQDYFESKPWYVPSDDDATSKLTEIEKKNIALILSLEQ